ncbi:MAG: ADP-ribosylglycohydrolase family protein [Anaerovoracaceae bacterium]|jgi:ADP-ribosylglycohydrolase
MTFTDRAYGALAGGVAGLEIGKPAFGLTRYEIQKKYDRITGLTDDAGQAGSPEGGIMLDEARVLAALLIRDGRFDAAAFKTDLQKAGAQRPADMKQRAMSAETFKSVPIGIKYSYDIPVCIDTVASIAAMHDDSSPALAGACAVAAAVAAGIEGNCTRDDVMQLAFDSAVYGERRGKLGCGPSLSRRIKLAKKLVADAEGAELGYLVSELTDVFGSEDTVYESVPLVLGIFYAVNGNAKKGIEEAVNAGGAADTNAALCGAVCGAFSGINVIPVEWSSRAEEVLGTDLREAAAKLARRV